MHSRVTKLLQIIYVIGIPEETTGNKGEGLKLSINTRNKRHQATNPRFSESKTRRRYSPPQQNNTGNQVWRDNSHVQTPAGKDWQDKARRLPRGKRSGQETQQTPSPALNWKPAGLPLQKAEGTQITTDTNTSSKDEVTEKIFVFLLLFFSFFLFPFSLFGRKSKNLLPAFLC